jgi:hypothetical protein
MRRWLVLNIALAVIVLGLGVQIVRTWARSLPPIEARAAGKMTDVPRGGGEGGKRSKRNQADKGAQQTPALMVASIVNKDLFDPSRTKQAETAAAAPVIHETAPPPGISLVGVRAFGNDREGFILDATQANTQRRIRPGDTIGNFTVKRIYTNKVVLLSSAGDKVTLSLELDKSKNPTGSPAPPARPGRPQAANAAAGSPAAGVSTGASPAAGIGGAPKPPVTAAGTAAAPPPPVPGQPVPPAPGTPPPPTPGANKRAHSPNLPDGVRQKLEQMKGLNKR